MTHLGKILVILIMVFSLFFLAVSTVVFTTHRNWREEAQKLKTQITKLQADKNDASTKATAILTDLQAAKDAFTKDTDILKVQIKDLSAQNGLGQQRLTEQNTALANAQQMMKSALAEAEARKAETDQLRTTLAAVQKQANDFSIAQAKLKDEIRIRTRENEAAVATNRQLRDDLASARGALRRSGLSDDPSVLRNVSNIVPPDVEGYVKRVDERNQRIEISIGSDDGLRPGHELVLYRTNPTAEYLGRVRIEATDADQSVAVVVGKTIQGKKILEGDIVSSKIQPRS